MSSTTPQPRHDDDAVEFMGKDFRNFEGVKDEDDFAARGTELLETLRSRLQKHKVVTMGDFHMILGTPGFTAVTGGTGDLLTAKAREVVVSVVVPDIKTLRLSKADYWSKTSSDLFMFRRQFIPGGTTYHYEPGDTERDDIIMITGELGGGKVCTPCALVRNFEIVVFLSKTVFLLRVPDWRMAQQTYFALGTAITDAVGNKAPEGTLSTTLFVKLGDKNILADLEDDTDDVVAEKVGKHVKEALTSFGYPDKYDMRINVVVDRANKAGGSLGRLGTLQSIMAYLKEHVATRPRLIVADCGIATGLDSQKDVFVVRVGPPDLAVMFGNK